jgi:hypothetical protein
MTSRSEPGNWQAGVFGNRDEQPRSLLPAANVDHQSDDGVGEAEPEEQAAGPKPLLGPRDPHPARTPAPLPSRRIKAQRRKRPAKKKLPNGTIGLGEWHALTPSETETAWAQLKEWVTWLHDRYELSVETRLPRCWPQHPALVEELWALKAWREEIYSADQPAGQAARYWHTELRGFITTAVGFYARNCRTGHKSDGVISATSDELRTAWEKGDPMAGIPAATIAKYQPSDAPGTARFIADGDMKALLSAGKATYTSDTLTDNIKYDRSWWYVDPAAPGGWSRVTDARYAKEIDSRAAAMANIDATAKRNRALYRPTSSTPATGTARTGD